MRQAGRYLPQYREVRRRLGLFDIIRRPDVCAEVTCQPVELLGVDAAILFSDISVAFAGMGVEFELREQVGPVVARPLRGAADVEALRPVVPEADVPYLVEAVRLACERLSVPLIGFAGGPFTLASYLIEGGPSRRFLATKRFMMSDPGLWAALMERLTDACVALLRAQVRAGASAVQVFDSWVGVLSPADFDEFVAPHVRRLFEQLRPLQVPAIYFGVETGGLLERMRETGASVLGVDWRTDLAAARRRLGGAVALQGNLDPATLLGPRELIARRAHQVLQAAGGLGGHIFNLGHGIPPEAEPDAVRFLVDFVHEHPPVPMQEPAPVEPSGHAPVGPVGRAPVAGAEEGD